MCAVSFHVYKILEYGNKSNNRKQITSCPGGGRMGVKVQGGVGEKDDRGMKQLLELTNSFIILVVGMASQVCVYINTQIVLFNLMQFVVFQLCFNKSVAIHSSIHLYSIVFISGTVFWLFKTHRKDILYKSI